MCSVVRKDTGECRNEVGSILIFKPFTVCSVHQAAITRCSQPLAGFSARCVEDEQMLQAVLKANPNSKFMYVVDTRPKVR